MTGTKNVYKTNYDKSLTMAVRVTAGHKSKVLEGCEGHSSYEPKKIGRTTEEYLAEREPIRIDSLRIEKALIKARLEELFGNDFDIIKDFMITTKAFLGGSTIVEAILNARYPDSDLDLYVEPAQQGEVEHLIGELMVLGRATKVDYGKEGDYPREWTTISVQYKLSSSSPSERYKKLQFILVEDHVNRIKEFDLDICMNRYYFDGNNEPQLEVNNLEGITNKVMRVNKFGRRDGMVKRLRKYSQRGFRLVGYEGEMTNLLEKLIKPHRVLTNNHHFPTKFALITCGCQCYLKSFFDEVPDHLHLIKPKEEQFTKEEFSVENSDIILLGKYGLIIDNTPRVNLYEFEKEVKTKPTRIKAIPDSD